MDINKIEQVPFIDLKPQYQELKDKINSKILDLLNSSSFILGPAVDSFEKTMSEYFNCSTISCNSGSDALFIALKAIGIKPGDEVITTPFTFFATAGAIKRAGGVPIFIDINPVTFNIDPNKIDEKVNKKTKAIIPVHLFGNPAEMNKINKIAKEHNLKIIEDACQAIGAKYNNKPVGTLGDIGCFSFYPTKNLGGIGEGGLITTKDSKLEQYMRKFRVHGMSSSYIHEFVGINSRLDAIKAAILEIKFSKLNEWNKQRQKIAKMYSEQLENFVEIPKTTENATHVYHQYVIKTKYRDELKIYLSKHGIHTGIYYAHPLHEQQCFKDLGYKHGDFPETEKVITQILSLPMYAHLTEQKAQYVINNIIAFFKEKEKEKRI